jgi:hypothetical protein
MSPILSADLNFLPATVTKNGPARIYQHTSFLSTLSKPESVLKIKLKTSKSRIGVPVPFWSIHFFLRRTLDSIHHNHPTPEEVKSPKTSLLSAIIKPESLSRHPLYRPSSEQDRSHAFRPRSSVIVNSTLLKTHSQLLQHSTSST